MMSYAKSEVYRAYITLITEPPPQVICKENFLKFGRAVFSEREREFTFAICYWPSACRLSVVHPTQPVEIFRNVFRHLVRWPPIDIHGKFYRDCPRGTPPAGGLNARRVVKHSDFRPIEGYILETVQDRR